MTRKTCPICAERVAVAARVCRYCGAAFDPAEVAAAVAAARRRRWLVWGGGAAALAALVWAIADTPLPAPEGAPPIAVEVFHHGLETEGTFCSADVIVGNQSTIDTITDMVVELRFRRGAEVVAETSSALGEPLAPEDTAAVSLGYMCPGPGAEAEITAYSPGFRIEVENLSAR